MGTINIPDVAEIVLDHDDSIKFETQTNGDKITIYTHLTKENSAILAYLANIKSPVKVEFKVVT